MPTMILTNKQVVELVNQLPPQDKRAALLALAEAAAVQRQTRLTFAEEQLRQLSAARDLDWDGMSDKEKEAFVDDLLHEDE